MIIQFDVVTNFGGKERTDYKRNLTWQFYRKTCIILNREYVKYKELFCAYSLIIQNQYYL